MTRNAVIVSLAAEAVVLAGIAVVSTDLAAHRRVERLGGVNVWGLRGPVPHRKQPREIRIAVVGGDLAFGWGVAASEALAPTIRQLVALETDKPGQPLRPVTAVTMGAMGLPVSDYAGWIRRFSSLAPDVVCIILDPAGTGGTREWPLPERRSLAWQLFGYAPILPLVIQEKGTLRRSALLQSIGSLFASIDRGLAALVTHSSSSPGQSPNAPVDVATYTAGVEAAVQSAESVNAAVVVVAPLYRSDHDEPYHEALRRLFDEKLSGHERVRFVDLGTEPELYDAGLRLNELDFSTAGHARVAEYLTPVVLSLVPAQKP
jgi:hypothetical protein